MQFLNNEINLLCFVWKRPVWTFHSEHQLLLASTHQHLVRHFPNSSSSISAGICEREHSAACFQCVTHVMFAPIPPSLYLSLFPLLSLSPSQCFSHRVSKCMLVGQLLHNRTLWVPSHVFCFSRLCPLPLSAPSNPVEGMEIQGEELSLGGGARLGARLGHRRPVIPIIRLLDITGNRTVENRIKQHVSSEIIIINTGFILQSNCSTEGSHSWSMFPRLFLSDSQLWVICFMVFGTDSRPTKSS